VSVPVVVAALGSQMLRLAGTMAEGTVTWMTGPKTVAEHVVPTITTAAAGAGRGDPKVIVALPICVTDDPAGARATAAQSFHNYGLLPSYRAMLDREGAVSPGDIAIVGDEATVRAGVRAVEDAGTT